MTATSGENIEWLMRANEAWRFNSERRWIAYEVFLETINMEDKNFFRSDSVYVYEITDEFIGMGNVEIISPRGTLFTEHIIWHRLSDRITAPNEVHLIRDGHQIWGSELYTNSNLDFIDMKTVSGHGVVEALDL
jgi:lipopolysaccharide assembly outer membrane protein LptD (OstA)